MSILIGADFVPTETNENYFIKGDADYLLGKELKDILSAADYRIFNLELPLVDEVSPISKCGPNLVAKTNAINLYSKIGVDLFTIANNHIYDQGLKGFKSTLDMLKSRGINYVGGGENLKVAAQPFIFRYKESKVGIYACVEHEFSIASETSPGANPFETLESYDHVEALSRECDYVIVLYHGGKEHYRYPSPNLQKYCRKFIDKGANLVICQHSHCIGCEEKYHKGTIVYGQGNFLFDHSSNECWSTGLLIEIDIKSEKIDYIPLIKKNETVRKANEEESRIILTAFQKRSSEIQNKDFIKENYLRFSEELIDGYLWGMSGKNSSILFRVLNRISGYRFYKRYVNKLYRKKTLLALLNNIECEAHREIIIQGLKAKKN